MQTEQFYYNNQIVKKFVNATIFWGLIGMSVGLLLSGKKKGDEFSFNGNGYKITSVK